ncbi:MAG TPA: twin-arginine translocase TatA/TatE family subunit [Bryobacteraceae bacterium]|nr:twin-arginine translocase TatA/TatE family subunit [Bryobacteraceae bacterium]
MGPIGVPEMMVIFLLALVLFGPKKLPELGRTLGRAITEFRRAQSELKATFDREMLNLERENESLKEITSGSSYHYDNYNYDYSSSDSGAYGEPYGSTVTEPQDSTVSHTSTDGASATEGAGSVSTVMPEGVVAHQSAPEGAAPESGKEPEKTPAVEHNA